MEKNPRRIVNPILIDRNFGIIAGHGRVQAAKEEKISEVPCVFVDYLTEAQKKAYILADNRFALDAGWDEELLKIELETLKEFDFDVSFTGFDESEIEKLMGADDGEISEDNFDADGYKFLTSSFEKFHAVMSKDASIYIFYATAKARIFHDAFEDAGFKVGAGLVWKKNQLVLTRTDWKYIHEPIIFGWRKDGKYIWYGDQKQTTVFEFDRIKKYF